MIVCLLGGLAVGRWMPEGVASRLVVRRNVSVAGGAVSPVLNQSSEPTASNSVTAKADVAKTVGASMADGAEARSLWLQYVSAGNQDVAMAGKNLMSAIKRWLAKDPQAACEFIFGLKGPRAEGFMRDFAREIQPEQIKLAFAVLLKHPELWEVWGLGSSMLATYAISDPEGAWREATTDGRAFPRAAGAIAEGWASVDPLRALAFAAIIEDGGQKSEFTRAALMKWGRSDAKAFLAWLSAQPDSARWAEQMQWTALDLKSEEDLRTLVKLMPPALLEGDNSGPFSSYDAGKWMSHLDWIERLPEGAARTAILARAAKSLSQSDPEKMVSILAQLPPGKERNNALANIAAYRAASSPEDGMAFASSIEDERARNLARRSAVQTWALSDPAGAAAWLIKNGTDKDSSALYGVGRTWAEDDPEGAAAFALANEAPTGKKTDPYGSMLGSAMNEWVKQDAYGASLWASQLQAGQQKDRVMSALAQGAVTAEPEGAMSWAMSIADGKVRQDTLESCFESWVRSNQSAASAWLRNAAVDEATRRAMTTALEKQIGSRSVSNGWSWRKGMTVVY